MKDLDLAESTNGKLRLAAGYKERLLADVTADADFLAVHGVMDYSLLVRSRYLLRRSGSTYVPRVYQARAEGRSL